VVLLVLTVIVTAPFGDGTEPGTPFRAKLGVRVDKVRPEATAELTVVVPEVSATAVPPIDHASASPPTTNERAPAGSSTVDERAGRPALLAPVVPASRA
jgi:hypothetical protein